MAKKFFTQNAQVFVQGKCLRIGSEIDGKKVGEKFLVDLKKRGFLRVVETDDEIKEPETPKKVAVDAADAVKKGKAFSKSELKDMGLAGLIELCAENGAKTEFSSKEECIEFLTKNK